MHWLSIYGNVCQKNAWTSDEEKADNLRHSLSAKIWYDIQTLETDIMTHGYHGGKAGKRKLFHTFADS